MKNAHKHLNAMPMGFKLPLTRFTWSKDNQSLVAECSDFGPLRETFDVRTGRRWIQQIWNDACDVGIAIISLETMHEERFCLHATHSRGGDLLYWEFKPVDDNCRVQLVTIFND